MKKIVIIKNRIKGSLLALRGIGYQPLSGFEKRYFDQQPSCQIPTLWHLFELFFGRRPYGQFVEVGAYDGVFASNSWGLASSGWAGLMIEPVPKFARMCENRYRGNERIRVLNMAIGPQDGQKITLFLNETLTTASSETNEEYSHIAWARNSRREGTMEVESVTLNTALRAENIEPGFDVLMVDVEGFETEVFMGFNLELWKPKMLIVELADTHPDILASKYSHAVLYQQFLSNYRVVYKDSINTIFVRQDIWDETFHFARKSREK